MISFVMLLWLTSISGTLVFGVWFSIAKWMEKSGYLNAIFNILVGMIIFWLIPISYILVLIENHKKWGGLLFKKILFLEKFSKIFFVFWFIGCCFFLARFLLGIVGVQSQRKNYYPVDDSVYDIFCHCCESLGIEVGKIEVFYDYRINSPFLLGLIKRYIVLPCQEYTTEQLTIIFMHEITHYKQKSIGILYVLEACLCVHFFNPFMWIFEYVTRYWIEYVCDYEVINRIDNYSLYFDIVRQVAKKEWGNGIWRIGFLENDIKDRERMMGKNYKVKKSKKILLVAAFSMVMSSSILVASATEAVGTCYYDTFLTTVGDNSQVEIESEGVEYFASGFERGVIVQKDWGSARSSLADIQTADWHINGNGAHASRDFNASTGQAISVSAWITPSNAVVRVGILQPDGILRYVLVNGTGGTFHRFELNQTGNYSVYVQNMSNTAIDVSVSYRVE